MIIDAHAHLWKKQNGTVNGKPVFDVGRGRSNFGGEIKQMMPPYMTDGENSVERFLANMDYAGVSGAVITQEYIDDEIRNHLHRTVLLELTPEHISGKLVEES